MAHAPIGAASWRHRWDGMAGNTRGAVWLILGCFCFATMAALIKVASHSLDSFQLAFLRASFSLLIVAPLILRAPVRALRTDRFGLLVLRGLFGSVGMMCGIYALTQMSLADASAIGFTSPLFLIVLAALVLGEPVGARRWSATAVGFVGVLIMLRPGDGVLEAAALVAVLGAFAAAVVKLLIRQLAQTEAPLTILAYMAIVSTAASAIPAALVWRTPGGTELALIFAAAGCTSLGQMCFIRGFKIGQASALAPFDYARLPFAALYGFWLFAELPDRYTLLGAGLIVASTLYIARREARLGRQLTVPRANAET